MDKIFALLSTPDILKTDNGPPFNSEEFKNFSEYLGYTALATNENTCENNLHSKNWRQELYTFLRAYRSTPHSSTQQCPAEILLHRPFKTQLPEMTAVKTATDQLTSKDERDMKVKAKTKQYADTRCHANSQTLQLGDRVLVKTPKINKFSSHYDPVPYEVTNIKGSMITASRPGHTITRNIAFFKKTTAWMPYKKEEEGDEDDLITFPTQQQQQPQQQPPVQPVPHQFQRRYLQRTISMSTGQTFWLCCVLSFKHHWMYCYYCRVVDWTLKCVYVIILNFIRTLYMDYSVT